MGRKEDLESHIRESYKLAEEYEAKIPTEDDPKRELRYRREADRLWNLIHGWLKEYLFLIRYLPSPIPDDIVQIAVKFPDIIPPPEPTARVQLILEGETLPLTEERQTALKYALTVILDLSQNDVRVLQVAAGSVRVTLELPKAAADQLLLLHESRELVIAGFQVESISILGKQPSTPQPAPTLFPSQTWLFVGLLAMDLILVFILGWRLVGDKPNLLAYLQVAIGVVGVIVTFLAAYVAVSRPVSAGAILYRFGTDRRVQASIIIAASLLIISVSFIPETGIPTPTATATPTSTATSTASATITPMPTATSTSTPTAIPTFTPTPTSLPTTTPTPTASPTVTLTPTPTATPTPTSSPTPTATPTPTSTRAIMALIEDEAKAVLQKDKDLLQQIYVPSGEVCDVSSDQCWPFLKFYDEKHLTSTAGVFTAIRHENFTVTVIEDHARATNDSCGGWQGAGATHADLWGNIKGDHWELVKIDGRWKIIKLSINNPLTTSMTYNFEDGTLGCWNLSEEGGRSLGFNLVNTGERFHTGSRSLKFNVDLQSDGEHRGRIEHRTSQPIPPLTQLSAWVLFIPSTGQETLEAEFFVWERNGTWHVTPTTSLEPYKWTQVAWESTNLDPGNPSTPVQMLGLEVKLKGEGSLQGEIYIDDLTIR